MLLNGKSWVHRMKTLYSVSRISEWIDCARLLENNLGWVPGYWVTLPENHDEIEAAFPGIISHPAHDLNRGLPAAGLEDQCYGGLSLSELDAARDHEAIAMDMMDRIDLGQAFSNQERQRLYHRLLIYWLNVIDRLDLQVAVFNVPPHSIGEYLAYTAFRIRGLKTRIFRPTPVDNLHVVCDTVEKLPHTLSNAYQRRLDSGNHSLGKNVEQDFERLENISSSYKPWYVEDVSNREDRWKISTDKLAHVVKKGEVGQEPLQIGEPVCSSIRKKTASGWQVTKTDILKRKRKPAHDKLVRQVFKVPGQPISVPLMNKWDYVLYRDWAFVQKLKLKECYDSLVERVDHQEKYVYFAMHYQPERTTCPDGGRFNNQFLAISLLSKALPEGWKIYVKEHPSQFNFHGMGELSRWMEYYDDIALLPNVRLISVDTPSMELMDHAQVVATITGAAGWEALIRGIPILCFGAAWYGLCRGAYVIEELEHAITAFHDVIKGKRPTKEDARAYAGALEDIGKVVYTNPSLAKAVNLEEPLPEALASLLIQFEMDAHNQKC